MIRNLCLSCCRNHPPRSSLLVQLFRGIRRCLKNIVRSPKDQRGLGIDRSWELLTDRFVEKTPVKSSGPVEIPWRHLQMRRARLVTSGFLGIRRGRPACNTNSSSITSTNLDWSDAGAQQTDHEAACRSTQGGVAWPFTAQSMPVKLSRTASNLSLALSLWFSYKSNVFSLKLRGKNARLAPRSPLTTYQPNSTSTPFSWSSDSFSRKVNEANVRWILHASNLWTWFLGYSCPSTRTRRCAWIPV